MASIFTHVIALPPYALALFIMVVLCLLGCAGAWVLLIHRRRFRVRIPTTQVEAQVQVQVHVEKVHDPTPARSSSWLGLPFTPSTTPSPSDTWIQRILRRHSKESATVAPRDAPPPATHTPIAPPLDGSQPPRPVKKELWLAFDSDATLATLRNDPLGEHVCKAPYRGPTSTRAAPYTPSLVDDKSTPPSPVSFWEPFTPPLVSENRTSASISSFGSGILAKLAVGKDEETDRACPCPHSAPEGMPLFLPSTSSSVSTLIHDTPSLSALGGAFSSEQEMDSDTDLKVSCKRLAALIDAISVSFSASTLGPPFSRRTTRVGLGDSGYGFGDESFSDDDDFPFCDDDDDDDDNDGEWDLGTAKLHGTAPQRDYSVLAI